MKISEYPKISTVAATDMFLLDGSGGTKIVSRDDLMKSLSNDSEITLSGPNMSGTIYATKRFGFVHFYYSGDNTSFPKSTDWVKMCTLPSGYRPRHTVKTDVVDNDRRVCIKIETDGSVYMFNYTSDITARNNFSFTVTFAAITF